MTPKVSIIIPTYNAAKTIRETIQSALKQTYQNIEIIIINDGSTDNTTTIVKSMTDKQIKIYSQKNQGPSAARNYGAKKATGKYFSFLDTDDIWHPKKLETEIALLQQHNAKAIISGVIVDNGHNRRYFGTRHISFEKLLIFNYGICGSNLTIEKHTFDKYHYNEMRKTVEDYDILLRLAEHNLLISTPTPLITYNHNIRRGRYYCQEMLTYIQNHWDGKTQKTLFASAYFNLFTYSLTNKSCNLSYIIRSLQYSYDVSVRKLLLITISWIIQKIYKISHFFTINQ